MKTADKEEQFIGRLRSDYIGDDAAVIGDTLYSSDAFFEDVHFRRDWMSLTQIARKAMLVNFSDAVAMNATPTYALVTLSLPHNITEVEIGELVDSFEQTAQEFGCEIIGGDTIGGDKLHISITIISHSNNPLMRKGLKEGDLLAFTGVLGESRRDLQRLIAGNTIDQKSRFYEPILRSDFIRESREFLRTGMDISDGLYCDCNKMLDINSCGIEVLMDIDDALGLSGEEYEMLIGCDPDNIKAVSRIAQSIGLPLTIFGKVIHRKNRFSCKSHHF